MRFPETRRQVEPSPPQTPQPSGRQAASSHTNVEGSRLTQGPILHLFSVTDIKSEATGAAVQFTALGALNFGEGLPLVQLAHEFLGVKGGTLQGPGVWLLRGARLLAASSHLFTFSRTFWSGATGSKEAPVWAGVPCQRQPAIWGPVRTPWRSPVPPALLAPGNRRERMWLSLCSLGSWHSWPRGSLERPTVSKGGDGCRDPHVGGSRTGSGGHFCLSSSRPWSFS